MPHLIEVCRRQLQQLYQSKLGREFSETVPDVFSERTPVWLTLSLKDFTRVVSETSEHVGLLLDPEIGTLLYVLSFSVETDLEEQIARALALRSKLLPEMNYQQPNDASDKYGAWRVALVWLVVGHELRQKWTESIVAVRHKTSSSEELPVDAVFLAHENDLQAFEEHRFPRLLLTTREVLEKRTLGETVSWLSADSLVKTTLSRFEDQFVDPQQQKVAHEIERQIEKYESAKSGEAATLSPRTLDPLRAFALKNFRNIRSLELDFGSSPVNCRVLTGPNGTGKTAVFEALSCALFGSSCRYRMFAERSEFDVSSSDRSGVYIEKYLKPLGNSGQAPQYSINGSPYRSLSLVDTGELAKERDFEMSGTLLSQETSKEFLLMRSQDLGARVLAGYSRLANHLEDFVDRQYNSLNANRQAFLRDLQLPASITRFDTVCERIAKSSLAQVIPPAPTLLVQWAEQFSHVDPLIGSRFAELLQNWNNWEEVSSDVDTTVCQAVSETPTEEKIKRIVYGCLNTYDNFAARTRETLREIENLAQNVTGFSESQEAKLLAWGTWLQAQANARSPKSDSNRQEIEKLNKQVEDLGKKQQLIINEGLLAKEHLEHLTQIKGYLSQRWYLKHPNECPSCGANHPQPGGILEAFQKLNEKVTAQRAALLAQYNSLTGQIKEVQAKLTELGKAQCPVSAEEQASLIQCLQPLLPEGSALAGYVASPQKCESLLKAVQLLRRIPSAPREVRPQPDAERVAQKIVTELHRARHIFEAPTNWKAVADKFTFKLSEVVSEHLPNTLGALWMELVFNLTPGRWLLPASTRFDVRPKRGEQRVSIIVGSEPKNSPLARYILNHSEMQVMGLAWFFARYFTHGRFYRPIIAMDDPAQDFDQTTFRELCRLLETIVRLHKVNSLPLTILVMLHQEERALAVARATGGLLNVLNWSKEQEAPLNTVSLLGDGFAPPDPAPLFKRSTVAG